MSRISDLIEEIEDEVETKLRKENEYYLDEYLACKQIVDDLRDKIKMLKLEISEKDAIIFGLEVDLNDTNKARRKAFRLCHEHEQTIAKLREEK